MSKQMKQISLNEKTYWLKNTGWCRYIRLVLALIAGVLLCAIALRVFVLPGFRGGIDFYAIWKAARVLFLGHLDPYSPSVTQEIQRDLFGRMAASHPLYPYLYPLYLLLLLFPIIWLPFQDALAGWLAFLLMGTGVTLFLLVRHYDLGHRPATRGLFVLWSLLLFPSIAGFWLAQPSVLIFLLFSWAWLALKLQQDWLVGICLGLLIIKPQVVALPMCLLLVYALWQRRLKVIWGFGIVAACLVAGSFLFFPAWLGSFLTNAQQYVSHAGPQNGDGPALQLFTELAGSLNIPLFVGAMLIIGVYMLWTWWQAIKGGWSQLEQALVITMLAQDSLFSAQHAPNQLLLLIPCYYLLAKLPKGHHLWLLACMFEMLVLPWLLRLLIPSELTGSPWLLVPIPLTLAILTTIKHKLPTEEEPSGPLESKASVTVA